MVPRTSPKTWSIPNRERIRMRTFLVLWFTFLYYPSHDHYCKTQCPTCPDPSLCARLLEDKWRQAYAAVFRFGPCQPSMVFRYLRTLEGVSPPLALSHLACQTTAKAFVATRKHYPSFLHLSRTQRLPGRLYMCLVVMFCISTRVYLR